MPKALLAVTWLTRLVAAGILAMAGIMKISGDPGSVYLMETLLGAPSIARLGLGGVELVAAGLLLVPKTTLIGSGLAAVLMLGAIGSHLTKLGVSIEVAADAPEGVADAIGGPTMFAMAVVVLLGALANGALAWSTRPNGSAEANKSNSDATEA
ncbi:MAG: putative membrane protein YphA (DoxX/SURF4 family) [Phycisphaerales bacterium]|jgi:uncharacterized membrane protein YphA (DoxX/SURF4 family)